MSSRIYIYFIPLNYLYEWIVKAGNGAKPFSISSSTTNRCMSGYTDSMLLAEFDKRVPLKIRVNLNLVH